MLFINHPVVQLPKITTSTATDLAAKMKAQPAAQALAKPGQTSSEYVHTLEQNKMHMDAVHALAHGMPQRESVWWACQSSQKVAGKLNPEELAAHKAAEAWVKNPTEANKAAAAQAASKTDFKGPGGWSAQAAAWSHTPSATPKAVAAAPPTKAVTGAPAASASPNLTASAVAGAVLLAAGLHNRPAMTAPQKPNLQMPQMAVTKAAVPNVPQPQAPAQAPVVDNNKMAKMLQPFLDLGKNIASGKNSWA